MWNVTTITALTKPVISWDRWQRVIVGEGDISTIRSRDGEWAISSSVTWPLFRDLVAYQKLRFYSPYLAYKYLPHSVSLLIPPFLLSVTSLLHPTLAYLAWIMCCQLFIPRISFQLSLGFLFNVLSLSSTLGLIIVHPVLGSTVPVRIVVFGLFGMATCLPFCLRLSPSTWT